MMYQNSVERGEGTTFFTGANCFGAQKNNRRADSTACSTVFGHNLLEAWREREERQQATNNRERIRESRLRVTRSHLPQTTDSSVIFRVSGYSQEHDARLCDLSPLERTC
jgi:hypothetical protein